MAHPTYIFSLRLRAFAYMDVGKGREQEAEALRQSLLTLIFLLFANTKTTEDSAQ